MGIDFGQTSVMLRNVEAFGFGYTTVRTLLVTANGLRGVRDADVVEVVAGTTAAEGAGYDRMEVKSAGGYDIDGLTFSGIYAAPHYKARGSSAHTDTIQFVTTSGNGTISDVVIEDSAVFQSTNQGIIAGNNSGGEIRNTLVVGGKTASCATPSTRGVSRSSAPTPSRHLDRSRHGGVLGRRHRLAVLLVLRSRSPRAPRVIVDSRSSSR